MKRITLFILTVAAAIFFAACAPPDKPANTNTNAGNANTNANAAKPAAAAPTKEALMAMENKAIEAWKTKDSKFWDGFLADNFVGLDPMTGKRMGKADLIKMMSDDKCVVGDYKLSDDQMTPAGADAAILTYKISADFKCDGKTGPPVVWAGSVYVRSGDTWKGAYHNEAPVIDPKAPPPAAAAKDKAKPAAPAAEEKAPAADDPMVAVIRKGWDAWKNRDAKGLGDGLAKEFVLIDPLGRRFDGASAVKVWTEEKCEIKSFSFTNTESTSFGKDMGIVTLKGNADGLCDGHPLGSLFGTYVMVKDGEAWKVAMIFESPAS